jgi:DNA-directed RNA polymerase specialized sigma24 family protein
LRKNWLGRVVAGDRFHVEPPVPDRAFQDVGEPYPDHWRHPHEPWVPAPEVLGAALAALPATWREVLLRHDRDDLDDTAVAAELGLTVGQVRDVLARARAALRDGLAP